MSETYPPENHYLRDLQLRFAVREDGLSVQLPISEAFCDESGQLLAGILATAIDIGSGAVAGRLASPDWVATSDISLHVLAPLAGSTLRLDCTLVRRGRSLIVLQTDVFDADQEIARPAVGAARATAGCAFAVLPDRGTSQGGRPGKRPARGEFPRSESPLEQPILEKLGIEAIDAAAGRFTMPLSDYVRNTYSALQGGLSGVLAELACRGMGECLLGRRPSTRDLRIRYLSQGRVGPFKTKTELLRHTSSEALARVRIVDCGAEDRPVAVASVSVALTNTEPASPQAPEHSRPCQQRSRDDLER